MGSISNVLSGTSRPADGTRLPIIQPTTPDQGAPSHAATPSRPTFFPLPKGHTHATAIASSGSSTAESISELTSSSSRDSLPATQARGTDWTPQKQGRNNRRNKSTRPNARWSRGGGSSDDPGSDRKPPTSQPSEPAPKAIQSPQTAAKQRQQPPIASTNPPTSQTRLMATTFGGSSGDSRRGVVSPRPKGRGMKTQHMYTLLPSLTGPCRSEEHFLPQCHHLRTLPV